MKELRQQLAAQNAATNADATTPLGFRQAWPRSRQHSVSGSGHVSTSQAPITAEEEEKYYQHLLKQEQVLQPFWQCCVLFARV